VKAFVTGGTGFVGSHLVDALLARGDEVVCLVRDPAKAERVFGARRKPHVIRGDLSTPEPVLEGIQGADLVFHVAGLIAARSKAEFWAANAEGTQLVAEAAADAAPSLKRFVYVSSLAAAGPSRVDSPLSETMSTHPLTMYGRSKLAGEHALADFPFPWTVIRPPVVYGPRDTEMYRVFRMAGRGLAAVFGQGNQQLSFIYVRDLVTALLHAADSAAPHSVYFAAHPEVVTSRAFVTKVHHTVRSIGRDQPFEGPPPFILPIPGVLARAGLWLSEKAARLTGKATVLTLDKANEFLAEAWVCSSQALERDTGWHPEWDLTRGLAYTAKWYRDAGWL
jgi:nucleoside-diphosphate-sugar epimerase